MRQTPSRTSAHLVPDGPPFLVKTGHQLSGGVIGSGLLDESGLGAADLNFFFADVDTAQQEL